MVQAPPPTARRSSRRRMKRTFFNPSTWATPTQQVAAAKMNTRPPRGTLKRRNAVPNYVADKEAAHHQDRQDRLDLLGRQLETLEVNAAFWDHQVRTQVRKEVLQEVQGRLDAYGDNHVKFMQAMNQDRDENRAATRDLQAHIEESRSNDAELQGHIEKLHETVKTQSETLKTQGDTIRRLEGERADLENTVRRFEEKMESMCARMAAAHERQMRAVTAEFRRLQERAVTGGSSLRHSPAPVGARYPNVANVAPADIFI